MSNRIEPALVELIEEIVARRVKEELKERAQLVTVDQFAEAMERIDLRFEAMERRFEAMDRRFDAMQAEMDRRFDAM
jgi:chaperonin cofactor prefoldin